MNALKRLLPLVSVALVLAACSPGRDAGSAGPAGSGAGVVVVPPASDPVSPVPQPRAVVYRTRADYRDRVPVALSADGRRLLSFPAPTDVGPDKRPVALSGDYLLDRCGIGSDVAFLDYTYEEYARLSAPLPPDTLLAHVLDAAPLLEMYRLPLSAGEAARWPERCAPFVANGFSGCEVLLSRPSVRLP